MLRLSLGLLLLVTCGHCYLSGWVNSPGYPHGYLPFASLNWSRCAPEAHRLSLTLIHLDMEESQDCENDALEISSNGRTIDILCGQMSFEELESSVNPSLHSTSAGCLSLTFRSDYSNPERHIGFRGFYTVQDFDECEHQLDKVCTHFCHNFIGGYYCSCRPGYILDTDDHMCTVSCSEDLSGSNKGVISSPSRPYAENARCSYTLSVEPHLQLELEFSDDFDLEQGPDGQCRDTLTVETPSGVIGPFCGQVAPTSRLLTHSNHIRILFTSDDYGSNNGFTVFYRTRAQTCPEMVTINSSVFPKHKAYNHGDSVTVTCDVGHTADEPQDSLTISSQYGTTCQKTGIWSPIYNCEPVNCGPPDIEDDGILQLVDSDHPSTLNGDKVQFKCSSKYYTLEGNDTYICNASGLWVSIEGSEDLPKCTEVCGKTENNVLNPGMILGGAKAKLGEIPWQLLIKRPKRGGASLISDRWAVTAAHVVDGSEQVNLHGSLIDSLPNDSLPNGVLLESAKIIVHPKFTRNIANHERANYDNDIALIRMASRVQFGPNLLPICLPEAKRGLQEDELGTVSGWGMTERSDVSQILRYADIAVYSTNECNRTPALGDRHMAFTDNMFCAGAEGKDSCSRDSGGPFVVPKLGFGNKNNRGPYRLEGIVSWGADCKERQYKGYYTMVDQYLDWIHDTIKEVEAEEW